MEQDAFREGRSLHVKVRGKRVVALDVSGCREELLLDLCRDHKGIDQWLDSLIGLAAL